MSLILPKTPNSNLLSHLETQSLVVLGLGKEGISSLKQFRSWWPTKQIGVADLRELDDLPPETRILLAKDGFLTTHLGADYLQALEYYQIICKTAGIPAQLPEIQTALSQNSRLTSNTQIFFELCPSSIIGVTGTKGKSTTSTAIYEVLKAGDISVHLVGNIGTAPLEILSKCQPEDWVVMELSSHQLANLTLSPQIAVVQEITTEHLDYYANTQEYQQAKTSMTRFQNPEDWVIYDPELANTQAMAELSPGKKLTHSLINVSANAFIHDGQIQTKLPPNINSSFVGPANKIMLKGAHNLQNCLPAVLIGKLLEISTEKIMTGLTNLRPLPHRLELIRTHHEIDYYNDSLSTTPESAMAWY